MSEEIEEKHMSAEMIAHAHKLISEARRPTPDTPIRFCFKGVWYEVEFNHFGDVRRIKVIA